MITERRPQSHSILAWRGTWPRRRGGQSLRHFFAWFHSIVLLTCLAGLALLPACASKQSQMGVRNSWRAASPPQFQKGRTSQSEVMSVLGPPSQVIALHDQTLFYYLREQLRTKAVFLILYNQTRENVSYDRAIFFFDKNGILSDFAYSKETIPFEE